MVQYLEILFRCRATGGTARVNDSESVEVGWHALDRLPDLDARTVSRITHALRGTDRAAYAFSGVEKVLGSVALSRPVPGPGPRGTQRDPPSLQWDHTPRLIR